MRKVFTILGMLIAVTIMPAVSNGQNSTGQFGVEYNVGSLEAPITYEHTMDVIGVSPIAENFKKNLDSQNINAIIHDINSWKYMQKNAKEAIIGGFRGVMPYALTTVVHVDFGTKEYHGSGYLSDDYRFLMIRGFLLNDISVEFTSGKHRWISQQTTFKTGREEGMMLLEWNGSKWDVLLFAPEWCMNFSELSYCLITVDEPIKPTLSNRSEGLSIQTVEALITSKLDSIKTIETASKKADAEKKELSEKNDYISKENKNNHKSSLFIENLDFGLSYTNVNSSSSSGSLKSQYITPRVILDFMISKDSTSGLILGAGIFNPINASGPGSYMGFIGKLGYQFQGFSLYIAARSPSPNPITWVDSPLDYGFSWEGGASLKLKSISIGGYLAWLRNRANSNPARKGVPTTTPTASNLDIGFFIKIPLNKKIN